MRLIGRIFVEPDVETAIISLTVEFEKIGWIEQTIALPLYIYRLFFTSVKKLDFLGINCGRRESGCLKSREIESVNAFFANRDLVVLLVKYDPFVPNLTK
jgi:hypothetical protein